VRAGESAADGMVGAGAGVGVLVLQRVGRSGAAGDECADSDVGSAIWATELRVGRVGKTGVFKEAWSDAFGAGARMGTVGEMFPESGGFGTRRASRINLKSRPNS
jgi:hypothetical protein